MTGPVLETLVRYIYSSQLHLTEASVVDICNAAELLQLHAAVEMCRSFMADDEPVITEQPETDDTEITTETRKQICDLVTVRVYFIKTDFCICVHT